MKRLALLLGIAALMAHPVLAADPATIDWAKLSHYTVTLFYPGQSSYEWLQSPDHMKSQKKAIGGRACVTCHEGEEKILGDMLVKGGDREPMPVKDKHGSVDLVVQIAYDAENAYFRFRWKTQNATPGIEYPYYRFDGKTWQQYGFPKLDQVVQSGEQPGIYEDRLSVMIDDGKVPLFAQQGCWLTCHTGQRDMPKVADAEAARRAMAKPDVRKYLPASRTDPNDWSSIKSPEEIAQLMAAGNFVDLVQWRGHRTNPVGAADDGFVLDYRNFDAGQNAFASNMDSEKRQPKFMFDPVKFGAKAVSADRIGKTPNFLIKEVNALPFDPNAGWKEGDLLPRYVLTQTGGEGSAADNKAKGEWKDGTWTVVVTRPLGLANPDDKSLKDGGVYNVGFAVHDDNITTRGHFVSFAKTIGFGAKADIEAVKLP